MSEAASTPPTFESALERLVAIVHELEEGNLGIETSLTRFEEGIGLLRDCYRTLEQAEQRIEILVGSDADGNPLTGPFDAAATIEPADPQNKRPGRRRSGTTTAAPQPDPEPDVSKREESRLF